MINIQTETTNNLVEQKNQLIEKNEDGRSITNKELGKLLEIERELTLREG